MTIGKGIRGHRFPHKSDETRAQGWLTLCKIEVKNRKTFDFNGLYIRGRHFADDAYEKDLQAQMGFKKNRKPELKSDAMPTLHMPHSAAMSTSVRATSVNPQRHEEEENQRKRARILIIFIFMHKCYTCTCVDYIIFYLNNFLTMLIIDVYMMCMMWL